MKEPNDERIEFRVPRDTKRKTEDMEINISDVCREAVQRAVGSDRDVKFLMMEEENQFGKWADSFIKLYTLIEKQLNERDNLVLAELNQLESLWSRIQERMKTTNQIIDEIPELKELRYEDIFDWRKIRDIINKYPKIQGRIGHSNIREAVLYREVKKGNFESVQIIREKMKIELQNRANKLNEDWLAYTKSKEFKRKWLSEQERLANSDDIDIRKNAREVLSKLKPCFFAEIQEDATVGAKA